MDKAQRLADALRDLEVALKRAAAEVQAKREAATARGDQDAVARLDQSLEILARTGTLAVALDHLTGPSGTAGRLH